MDETRVSCDEFVTTLQPYVDGELGEAEHGAFAEHVARCTDCRTTVREQQRVRAALRGLVPEFAPALLRERIMVELDHLDEELAEPSLLSRWRDRFSAFARGGLVFVPAAAVAAFMMLGVRHFSPAVPVGSGSVSGDQTHDTSDSQKPGLLAASFAAEHDGPFEIQVPSARSLPRDVELVGAASASPADPYQARVEYADRTGRVKIIDRQRRGGELRPAATHRVFRGERLYYLSRDERGRAFVEFTVGDVHHRLDLQGSVASANDRSLDSSAPDFRTLVNLAEALGRARAVQE